MRIRQALPGFALFIAVPLIPGVALLAAGQPAAPGCAPAGCQVVLSRPQHPDSFPRPAAGGISRAECIPPGPVYQADPGSGDRLSAGARAPRLSP
jgi:hypothetical protein